MLFVSHLLDLFLLELAKNGVLLVNALFKFVTCLVSLSCLVESLAVVDLELAEWLGKNYVS